MHSSSSKLSVPDWYDMPGAAFRSNTPVLVQTDKAFARVITRKGE